MPQFTRKANAGSRIYFFDVRVDRNGCKYITISELTKATDSRSCVFLHHEDFDKFRDALDDAIDFVRGEDKT